MILIALLVLCAFFFLFAGALTTSKMYIETQTPKEYRTFYEESKTLEKTEYELKEGYAEIKSSESELDYERIKQRAEALGGWSEAMSKSEDFKSIRITSTLKIPSESFESFADWLIKNFDVKNTNLAFYRVSVEKQKDEIEILLDALAIYDRLMARAEAMSVNETTIDTILMITEKKLEVMRLLKSYGYSVEQIEERARYASITISILQEKPIKIMPEDKGRELMTKLRNSVNEIVNAGIDLISTPIVLIVKVIVWIIYAIIVLIPVFIAYKIFSKIFKWLDKKIR